MNMGPRYCWQLGLELADLGVPGRKVGVRENDLMIRNLASTWEAKAPQLEKEGSGGLGRIPEGVRAEVDPRQRAGFGWQGLGREHLGGA